MERERSGLQRVLGSWSAGAFVVTNMVGAGIFTVPAFVRDAAGNGLAALGVWLTGGLLALCGALAYAELATRMPAAGGEYHYLARLLGPVWGFLSGWISFLVGFSAAMAAAALGVVAYAAEAIGGWNPDAPVFGGVSGGALAAAVLVVVLSLYHCLGVEGSGRLQAVLAGLGLTAIGGLVLAGLASGRGDWGGVVAGEAAAGSWWVALIQVSFAYSGWNAAAYLAGEVDRPRHTLPRALLGGTVVVTAAYLALNVLFFYALPEATWEPRIAVGHMAAGRLFGAGGARAVSGLIALAIFGSLSAMSAAGPRVYWAMARDGLGIPGLGRLSARSQAPVAAILAQGGLASLLALTGAFETLLTYIGSALLLFSGLAVAAVYAARRRGIGEERAFRLWGYPVTPAIFLAVVTAALVNGLVRDPVPTGAALLTVVAGAVVYLLGRHRGWLEPSWQEEV